VPLPPTLKGKFATAVETINGEHPIFFLDKLGERQAFERAGTRLYGALLSKYDAYGSFTAGPSRDDLEHVREEEHRHCTLLQAAIA